MKNSLIVVAVLAAAVVSTCLVGNPLPAKPKVVVGDYDGVTWVAYREADKYAVEIDLIHLFNQRQTKRFGYDMLGEGSHYRDESGEQWVMHRLDQFPLIMEKRSKRALESEALRLNNKQIFDTLK